MRLHPSILLALLAAPPPAAAQAESGDTGWHLGGGVEAVRFGNVAVTDAAVDEVAAEVRPSGRRALHLSVGRGCGSWGLDLELGWAGGYIEAGNDLLSVQDRTADVSRYRLAIAIARQIASVGNGTIGIALAPTLDLWAVDGDSRVRTGAEGRLVLRVPLGSVELENRIGAGFSGNPIQAADIGEVSDLRGLRVLFMGVGLRLRT